MQLIRDRTYPRKERIVEILTSRGCPFNCTFCAGSSYWENFRMHSVNNIVKELGVLRDEYGVQEIQFSKGNMTTDRQKS